MAVMTEFLQFHTLDVFTETPFRGNPLAVVSGADGLSPAQMQTIAAEFNLSETIFIQKPRDPAHSARVRIFFPTAEIPFAGHPTIGCAIHLASQNESGDFDKDITLEEEAGLVPVRVIRRAGRVSAEFIAPVLPFAAGELPERSRIATALGLAPGDLSDAPAGVFEGGPRFLYVPVKDLGALGRARPSEPAWSGIMQTAGVDSAYLFTPTGPAAFRARMFSPGAGIPEDPATGSASAILAAWLLQNQRLSEGEQVFSLQQGVEMGRQSDLRLTIRVSGGALREIRIAGAAVPVSEGRIRRP
ncbi:PhzF family phenazine biosynthesis protein [Pseudogemmobacter faecipullorum]|uniref:PhzF family phenazine biosynthesis protein n=1 Tax=Pseudogemmobacter faecipullorum TaxID=2755041 RepID=A0ABS8CR95_9RHOB|nr:PhzF family phenazine biosynthesis protein [Pseudogemmobacter faecipullorum]MCB5411901.1 PhzF family phenazine biosynthesis protein [Pseudogemmobacter faecipullorum]